MDAFDFNSSTIIWSIKENFLRSNYGSVCVRERKGKKIPTEFPMDPKSFLHFHRKKIKRNKRHKKKQNNTMKALTSAPPWQLSLFVYPNTKPHSQYLVLVAQKKRKIKEFKSFFKHISKLKRNQNPLLKLIKIEIRHRPILAVHVSLTSSIHTSLSGVLPYRDTSRESPC